MQAGSSRQEEVRAVLQRVKSEGRTALSPLECSEVLRAYGVPLPREGVARSASEAADLAADIGFPVVMKIVSEDILHKTEAGGVLVGVADREQAERVYQTLMDNARAYKAEAVLTGVQVQQQVSPRGVEVIVGAVTDPSFGKVVAFGLGGVLVEVLRDVTFRLAPASDDEALSMLDGVAAAEILRGVRGAAPVHREALAGIIVNVSALVSDFPEIREVDLNPVLADADGATAVDSVMTVDFTPQPEPYRPSRDEIVSAMQRIMNPRAVAVIGASDGEGKIGNSVMKNIINGGYAGALYPINPRADEILGKKCYKSVKDIPEDVDVAIFAVPAKFCAAAMTEVGEKGIPGAVMIPSGFAEVGEKEMQDELLGRGAQVQRARHGAQHLRLLLHSRPTSAPRSARPTTSRGRWRCRPRAAAWACPSSASAAPPGWGSPPSSAWGTSRTWTRTTCSPTSNRTTTPRWWPCTPKT